VNSVIEAQETLIEECEKEIKRCRENPVYMFDNYWEVIGRYSREEKTEHERKIDLMARDGLATERMKLLGIKRRRYGF